MQEETMQRALPIVLGLLALAGAAAARPPALVLPLVQAQCDGAVACQPAFAFRTGSAQLTGAREPAPTCPKTGKPSETPGGAVKMTGVSQNGAPFSGTLAVEVTNLTTFGSDAGACPLNGLQIETPSLNGTLTCKSGRCKGSVLPAACLPRECADVSITTELRLLEVLDAPTLEGGRAIARPGLFVAPAK
jgi:hypothetical protein